MVLNWVRKSKLAESAHVRSLYSDNEYLNSCRLPEMKRPGIKLLVPDSRQESLLESARTMK
jgi:hypothetical protein